MLSTVAFTVCFAVWTLFAIVGIKIKQELSLDDSQFGLLVATPVLTGALSRLFLGLLSDKFGGRGVFALLMFGEGFGRSFIQDLSVAMALVSLPGTLAMVRWLGRLG